MTRPANIIAAAGLEVVHDPDAGRFDAVVDGMACELLYRLSGGTMQIVHTEVDPRLRGRGVAGALVDVALEWARANALQVVPLCSYVAAYMRRHPDTAPLLAPRRR